MSLLSNFFRLDSEIDLNDSTKFERNSVPSKKENLIKKTDLTIDINPEGKGKKSNKTLSKNKIY